MRDINVHWNGLTVRKDNGPASNCQLLILLKNPHFFSAFLGPSGAWGRFATNDALAAQFVATANAKNSFLDFSSA